MIGVALVAAAVRLPGVYTQAFWQDEVASARILDEPTFRGLLAHVARTESTPPLWYALGWLLRQAGTPMQDVRLLSVAAGALLAALVVDLARRFVPLPFAALAGLCIAFGGELVGHGQELRAYELLALLSVVLARCLLAEVEEPSRRRELALGATVAAGGLTHYFFAFSVFAALAWLWLDRDVRAVRRRATAAILAGGAAAAAWGPVMLTQFHQGRFWWIGAFRLRTVLAVPTRLFTYAYSNTSAGIAVSIAGLALVGAGCARLSRMSAAGRLVAILALVPVVEAAAVWAGGVRIFALRNLIGVAPFVAVAVVAAVAALPRRVAAPAWVAAAALLVAAVHAARPRRRRHAAVRRDGASARRRGLDAVATGRGVRRLLCLPRAARVVPAAPARARRLASHLARVQVPLRRARRRRPSRAADPPDPLRSRASGRDDPRRSHRRPELRLTDPHRPARGAELACLA